MAKRFFCFIVALIFLSNGELFSQKITEIPPVLSTERQAFKLFPAANIADFGGYPLLKNSGGRGADSIVGKSSLQVLSPSFYAAHLSFFCRTELTAEKATAVPFKFRLGSVEYTDYLEQKPNALKPRQ